MFPIIPVTSDCSLWSGVPVICPAGLPFILAQGVIYSILFHKTIDLLWNTNKFAHIKTYLFICFIINHQRDAALSSLIYYLLRDHSTCFGCSLHPLSGMHQTVVTNNGTSHVSEWRRLNSVTSCQVPVLPHYIMALT